MDAEGTHPKRLISNWSDRYAVGLNAFGYKTHDQISVVDQAGSGLTFRNQGEETGYGLELEGSHVDFVREMKQP